jgi:hypothetical protein
MVPTQRSFVDLGQRHPPSLIRVDNVGVNGVDIVIRAIADLSWAEADDTHDAS